MKHFTGCVRAARGSCDGPGHPLVPGGTEDVAISVSPSRTHRGAQIAHEAQPRSLEMSMYPWLWPEESWFSSLFG